MCLDYIYKKSLWFSDDVRYKGTGYKVFLYDPVSNTLQLPYRPLRVHRLASGLEDHEYEVPIGEWIAATRGGMLECIYTDQHYAAGFHLFPSRSHANEYMNQLYSGRHPKYHVVVEVTYSGCTCMGPTGRLRTMVCNEIHISKEEFERVSTQSNRNVRSAD